MISEGARGSSRLCGCVVGRGGWAERVSARGGGADLGEVVGGGGGDRVDHRVARAVGQVDSGVAAVSGLPVGDDS